DGGRNHAGVPGQVRRLGRSVGKRVSCLCRVRCRARAHDGYAAPGPWAVRERHSSAVIECKGPATGVEQAVSQHIRNQQDGEIPGLFRTVQLLVATNKNDVRYGTVGTAASFWSKWAELEDRETDVLAAINAPLDADQNRQTFADGFREDRASYDARFGQGDRLVTEQDRVLWALARPERLLDLARRFTLFDAGEKKIARYQQFFAVRKILRRVTGERDEEGRRRGGVIWHTQGSGKSLTM